MPKFPIAPIIKLSKEQWKILLTRIFEKEAKLTEKAARTVMKFEPGAEKEMGTLFKDVPTGVGEARREVERLPIAEARAKYFASPESYVTPTTVEPSAKVLTQPVGAEAAGLSPEGLAQAIGYERLRFRPIIPPGVRRGISAITKGAEEEEVGAGLKRLGLTEEDIRPGVTPEKLLREKGVDIRKEKPSISKIIGDATLGSVIWKEMGGSRSISGKLWEEYYRSASGGVKSAYKSGQDYFISSMYKWRQDPSGFAKKHPREAGLLTKIWEIPKIQDLAKEMGVE